MTEIQTSGNNNLVNMGLGVGAAGLGFVLGGLALKNSRTIRQAVRVAQQLRKEPGPTIAKGVTEGIIYGLKESRERIQQLPTKNLGRLDRTYRTFSRLFPDRMKQLEALEATTIDRIGRLIGTAVPEAIQNGKEPQRLLDNIPLVERVQNREANSQTFLQQLTRAREKLGIQQALERNPIGRSLLKAERWAIGENVSNTTQRR